MLRRLWAHARQNGVAYIALFVALSGTAVAATSAVPPNSVGTAQLKAHAVTGAKVALHTLTGANVAKGTLTGANILSSTLGTVPNAAHLGGLSPAAVQRAITGKCSQGQAIRQVTQPGKVTCQSTGTVTGVTPGTGLTGGGSSGNVSLSIDPTVVQARVAKSCGPGHAIFSVRQDGSIGCHPTDVTQMMGGTGTATLTSTSDFLVPIGISTPSTQPQAVAVGTSDEASLARHLSVNVATAPPSGAGWTFEFYVDGRDRTGLACTITGPAHSCQTKGSVSIPASAQVALHAIPTNITGGTTATFGWTDTTF